MYQTRTKSAVCCGYFHYFLHRSSHVHTGVVFNIHATYTFLCIFVYFKSIPKALIDQFRTSNEFVTVFSCSYEKTRRYSQSTRAEERKKRLVFVVVFLLLLIFQAILCSFNDFHCEIRIFDDRTRWFYSTLQLFFSSSVSCTFAPFTLRFKPSNFTHFMFNWNWMRMHASQDNFHNRTNYVSICTEWISFTQRIQRCSQRFLFCLFYIHMHWMICCNMNRTPSERAKWLLMWCGMKRQKKNPRSLIWLGR